MHPELGSLADLDALIANAGTRGIRVLLDLVGNHTSDRHAWFGEARESRESARRPWYVWRDARADRRPPTDAESVFGGPAWTWDEETGQYYGHRFLPAQPDLDWRNEDVRREFDDILRFWFARGVAGFRIDVAHEIVKDDDQRVDVEETHAVLRRWRALCEAETPSRVLVGETWVPTLEELAAFYGRGDDELQLAFNFPFLTAELRADAMAPIVERTKEVFPAGAWPAWTGSNHDVVRFPTRWCDGDERKVRCALVILLTLRGTPFLYYGDELAMPQGDVGAGAVRDMHGRDGARTPMRWNGEEGAGFTRAGVRPWLPLGEGGDVAAQRADPGSVLHLCRDLIALRRELADLREAGYERLEAPGRTWAWRRGAASVAVNLSDEASSVPGIEGRVGVATDRGRDGETVQGRLRLGPWEAAVVV